MSEPTTGQLQPSDVLSSEAPAVVALAVRFLNAAYRGDAVEISLVLDEVEADDWREGDEFANALCDAFEALALRRHW